MFLFIPPDILDTIMDIALVGYCLLMPICFYIMYYLSKIGGTMFIDESKLNEHIFDIKKEVHEIKEKQKFDGFRINTLYNEFIKKGGLKKNTKDEE